MEERRYLYLCQPRKEADLHFVFQVAIGPRGLAFTWGQLPLLHGHHQATLGYHLRQYGKL